MPKVLITGFNGFVGRHACREFRERGFEIHGVTLGNVDPEARALVDQVSQCDLSKADQTDALEIDDIDAVLNLAGYATNTGGDDAEIMRINIGAHVNLYNRIRQLRITPRIGAISSAAVYDPDQSMPETEDSRLKDPNDTARTRAYEASKIHMERELLPFIESGLDIVTIRPFNHIGAGQGKGFIIPDITNKILTALDTDRKLVTGNTSTFRDYSAVEDVVGAYADLLEAESLSHRVYNVCSGRSRQGNEILRLLLTMLDPDGKIEVVGLDESLLRANDASNVYGSYDRIHDELGWGPTTPLEESVQRYVKWRVAQP